HALAGLAVRTSRQHSFRTYRSWLVASVPLAPPAPCPASARAWHEVATHNRKDCGRAGITKRLRRGWDELYETPGNTIPQEPIPHGRHLHAQACRSLSRTRPRFWISSANPEVPSACASLPLHTHPRFA